jgi:hypothetical protein
MRLVNMVQMKKLATALVLIQREAKVSRCKCGGSIMNRYLY